MTRVLLVDDDPIVVRIYRDGLSRLGFEIATAADGVAALKSIKTDKPDVVVLDLMMPRLSGVEVLKFIRAEKDLQSLPVIVLSNAYMDPLANDAAQLGAQKGLLKVKCNPASLAAAIGEVLEGPAAEASVDSLLAAAKDSPVIPEPPAPPPAAPPASEKRAAVPPPPELPQRTGESREQARLELANHAAATARTLLEVFESFKTARTERELELRLNALYRKVHFITAMAGLAEHRALAQVANSFEALLFSAMDQLPKLKPSLERTTSMTVEFLHGLLTKPLEWPTGPAPSLWALVADDDRLSNRWVISALRNAQFQARSTEDAKAALHLLEERHYDVVLLDIEMPGMDGIELCQRVRALPGYALTPIIYVTLHDDPETRTRAIQNGGTDLISKPVSPPELAVKVVMHLLKSQSPG